jgi:hypothetical protein
VGIEGYVNNDELNACQAQGWTSIKGSMEGCFDNINFPTDKMTKVCGFESFSNR